MSNLNNTWHARIPNYPSEMQVRIGLRNQAKYKTGKQLHQNQENLNVRDFQFSRLPVPFDELVTKWNPASFWYKTPIGHLQIWKTVHENLTQNSLDPCNSFEEWPKILSNQLYTNPILVSPQTTRQRNAAESHDRSHFAEQERIKIFAFETWVQCPFSLHSTLRHQICVWCSRKTHWKCMYRRQFKISRNDAALRFVPDVKLAFGSVSAPWDQTVRIEDSPTRRKTTEESCPSATQAKTPPSQPRLRREGLSAAPGSDGSGSSHPDSDRVRWNTECTSGACTNTGEKNKKQCRDTLGASCPQSFENMTPCGERRCWPPPPRPFGVWASAFVLCIWMDLSAGKWQSKTDGHRTYVFFLAGRGLETPPNANAAIPSVYGTSRNTPVTQLC